jgi:hypothetical protein
MARKAHIHREKQGLHPVDREGVFGEATWGRDLKTEREPSLQALGARLEENITACDAAIAERRNAAASTSDHRVREIVRFVDDVNASRRARYGVLIQRAEERGLPPDWPGRFFKKNSQGPKKVKSAPPSGNQPA